MRTLARVTIHVIGAAAVALALWRVPSPFHVPVALVAVVLWMLAERRWASRSAARTSPPTPPLREVSRKMALVTGKVFAMRPVLASTRHAHEQMAISISLANGADPDDGDVAMLRETFAWVCDGVEKCLAIADALAATVRHYINTHPGALDRPAPPEIVSAYCYARETCDRASDELLALHRFVSS